MRILLYSWDAYTERKIRKSLERMGHSVILCNTPCRHYTRDVSLAAELIELIHREKAELVFTVNYYPIISSVCYTVGILYYSWVFDSPHLTLFARQSRLDCNRIFVFDRDLQSRLRRMGVERIYHMPLASDAAGFGKVIARSGSEALFREKVSFLGTLYTDQYDYYDTLQGRLNDQVSLQELDVVIARYCFRYGGGDAGAV